MNGIIGSGAFIGNTEGSEALEH